MANAQPPGQGPFGKYWLERRIATGGTTEVYLARVGGPEGRPLVIKRALPELRGDPATTEIFAQEASLHAAVRHPNVVEVYEAGSAGGEPYLAMQYIEGVDALRMLRRSHADSLRPPVQLAIHAGLSLCEALDGVHSARDAAGAPLGLLHRDVTPSNVYLSISGDVVLGEFGVVRPASRSSRPQLQSSALKGKHSYLAPEQISGEPSDHRADLYSCAVVLSELLLGRPLFAGAGQVGVLLAIRDGRLDALKTAAKRLPPGLFEVLQRALAREPGARYPSARALAQALAAFEGPRDEARRLTREWVAWARDPKSKLPGDVKPPPPEAPPSVSGPPTVRRDQGDELIPVSEQWSDAEPVTARIDETPSRVRLASGRELAAVSFARLIEMAVTGELSPADQVDLMGQGFRRVADIELLERHLPAAATTRNLQAPAPPDEVADLSRSQLLPLLGRLAASRGTGLLLVEGHADSDRDSARREIYLQAGQLLHVTSGEPTDLLGQHLVRRGILTADELDMALAVMPRFQGRLGDTLIALGLIDAVVLFRAIEEQGRERFLRIFAWTHGQALFFRGMQPSRIEFPLELELPGLILAGTEVAYPNDAPIIHSRALLGARLRCTALGLDPSVGALPIRVAALLRVIGGQGVELRHALARLATSGEMQPADSLRAMYVAIAMGLCEVA